MKNILSILLLIVIILAPNLDRQPVLAETQVTMIDLGTLGNEPSDAYGINDKGQVVGDSTGHAVFWETNMEVHPGHKIQIALYNGSGAWYPGTLAMKKMFEFIDCNVTIVQVEDIINGHLDQFDVLAWPGGDYNAFWQVGQEGKAKIQKFISDGGGYMGICAGAWWACDYMVWMADPNYPPPEYHVQGDNENLDLFLGVASGPIEEITPYNTGTMTKINIVNHNHPITDSLPDYMQIMYWGGPQLLPYEDADVTILGTYDVTGTPAIVAFEYGKGRVFLCGPHPEIEEDSDRDGIYWFDDWNDEGSDWPLLMEATEWLAPTLEPVYLLKIVVYTNSDWTTVDLDGLSPLAYNASVTVGAETSDLRYTSEPGHIWIAKNSFDQTPISLETWFLTIKGEDEGLVSIEKGHIGDTVVDFYYYTDSWTRFASFTHSGVINEYNNTRNFTINYDQAYESPSCNATIEPVPANLRKSVYAFYYPWYNNPVGPSGKLFHWNSPIVDEPLFGLYDSKDEGVIEAHIMMAKAAGIDGFIVSWWGVGTPEDEALPIILRVADSLNFSISIYYESDRAMNLTVDEIIDELSYIIRTYSSNQAFLKANGKPVLLIYGVDAWNRSPSFWMDVVRGLEVKIGPVYLVGHKYADAFDGFHWYANADINQTSQIFRMYSDKMKLGFKGIDWDEAFELIKQGKNLPLKQKFLAFTIQPGFDLTKMGRSLYMDRKGGQTYKEYWRTALSNNPDGVLITSWNEWHEGTEIEPSIEYGFTYLNLTRQYVSLYKGLEQLANSPMLKIQTDLENVVRYGMKNASLLVINDSPNVQALYINLSIALSGGLKLTSVDHSGFYSYVESIDSRAYNLVIPTLKTGEATAIDITLNASIGAGSLSATATYYSPSGGTNLTSNMVTIIFDRIIADRTVETTSPRSISLTTKLSFESDGQPVDKASVKVNGVLAVETSPGTFQTTVATWSPLYRLDVTIERPGFSTQNVALSGYATGNMAVEASVAAILTIVLILILTKRFINEKAVEDAIQRTEKA